jgi:hypothetical protein
MNTETPKSIKQQLQFQLEFMCMMLRCGRDDDAEIALKKICDLVDSLED